jgi:hypothetical protein
MQRLRAWGWLLAVAAPFLVYISWAQLGSQASRKQLERYQKMYGAEGAGLAGPLFEFFKKQQRVAVAGDVQMPAPPAQSGIKQLLLRPDGVLHVEIDARSDGKPVVLQWVPIVVASAQGTGLNYDCVSDNSITVVNRICHAYTLKSTADIAGQLQANAKALQSAPAKRDGTGAVAAAGVAMGGVLFMPDAPAKLEDCGYQCVKPMSCANTRALVCLHRNANGAAELVATPQAYRGTDIATAQDAQKICEDLGPGYTLASSHTLMSAGKLQGGSQYWVNHPYEPGSNCWTGRLNQ